MVLFVTVGVQAFEFVPVLVAFSTKVKIVTILAHPAILRYHPLAIEAFQLLVLQKLFLKYSLEFVIPPVILRKVCLICSWPLEKTFLT